MRSSSTGPIGADGPEHGHGHGHGHGHRHGPAPRRGRGAAWWAGVRHVVVPHAHDAVEAINTAEGSARQGIRTAWIGLAGMMITALLQIVIVAISGSIALLADTVHNLGHAVTTIPLIIAFRLGRRPATSRYPYGLRRAEDLSGLLIALVILASVVLIVWESINALLDPRPLTNLGWVVAAGIVGALGNEIVAIYRMRTGRRIGSAALIAEGQHARADGLTSVAVVLGSVGVWLGFERADAVVGLLIAVTILGILINSAGMVLHRLLDGIDPGVLEHMRTVAAAATGVRTVQEVRARWVGHRMEGDAEIAVEAGLSLRAAHDVAEHVEHELLHAVPNLDRVHIHVHPDLGDAAAPALHQLTGHHASEAARRPTATA